LPKTTQWPNPLPLKLLEEAPVVPDNAALVTVDPLDHLANLVAMVEMAPTENQASPENVVNQLHRTKAFWTYSRNNAHAKLHQATKDRKDRKAPTDHQEMLVNQVAMENPEIKDHEDPMAKPANPETLDKKVPREQMARQHRKSDQLAHQAALANQVNQVLQVNPEVLAKMDNQADLAVQETPDHPVKTANLEAQDPTEMQENKATLEAALTAHRLVWLLAIKPRDHSFRTNIIQMQSDNFSASTSMVFFIILELFF